MESKNMKDNVSQWILPSQTSMKNLEGKNLKPMMEIRFYYFHLLLFIIDDFYQPITSYNQVTRYKFFMYLLFTNKVELFIFHIKWLYD